MDLFPVNIGTPGPPPYYGPPIVDTTGLVMGYYDGNTLTALWNYAQYYAMNDNSYGTTFGPSTPGALNVVAGQTDGVIQNINSDYAVVPDGNGGYSLVSDADPVGDPCSGSSQVQMGGKNIGDLLTRGGRDLGLLRRRIRPDHHQSQWNHRLQAVHGFGLHRQTQGRLHSPPPAVPVLHLDRQSPAHASHLGPDDRAQRRRRQSPVRHSRLLRRGQSGELPGSQLPEGLRLPGRPRRLFHSDRRAKLHRQRDQFPPAATGLGQHRRRHQLGRLRWLV